MLAATTVLEGSMREHEFNSGDVTYRTEQLVMDAVIPTSLLASPINQGKTRSLG